MQLHRHADGNNVQEGINEGGLLAQMKRRPAVQRGKQVEVRRVVEQVIVHEPGVEPVQQHEEQADRWGKNLLDHSIQQQIAHQTQGEQQEHGSIGRVPKQQGDTDQIGGERTRYVADGAGGIAIAQPGPPPGTEIAFEQHLGLITRQHLVFSVE